MSKAVEQDSDKIARLIREGKLRKPVGFIEDPNLRRQMVRELAGSMPDLPPVEEFLSRRRGS